jgi:hypothetical protein
MNETTVILTDQAAGADGKIRSGLPLQGIILEFPAQLSSALYFISLQSICEAARPLAACDRHPLGGETGHSRPSGTVIDNSSNAVNSTRLSSSNTGTEIE